MASAKIARDPDAARLYAGQRVSRKGTDEQGTVVRANGLVKVKWDGGRNSYFSRTQKANVRLVKPDS
jgi:hypothetical protein